MKMISERRAAAYVAIGVLLSGVIFGLAIPAAIQAGQRNAMNMAWEPAEASWYEERTQRTVYALDPTPSYLDLVGSELKSLSAEPDPDSVWDVSAQGLHPFRGTFRGQGEGLHQLPLYREGRLHGGARQCRSGSDPSLYSL